MLKILEISRVFLRAGHKMGLNIVINKIILPDTEKNITTDLSFHADEYSGFCYTHQSDYRKPHFGEMEAGIPVTN